MKLTLKSKLYGGVGAIVFLAGMLVIMGIWGIDKEAKEFDSLYKEDTAQTRYALDAGLNYSIAASALKSFLNNGDPAMRDIFDAHVKRSSDSLDKYKGAGDPEEQKMADECRKNLADLEQSWDDAAASRDRNMRLAISEKIKDFVALKDHSEQNQVSRMDRLERFEKNIKYGILLLTLLAALVAAVFSKFFVKAITSAIRRVSETAEKVAGGDLTQVIDAEADDEVGHLADTFNGMTDNLSGMIKKINEASMRLASASSQLSATSEQISKGAADQDSQVTRVAAAMEEMSASIQEVASHSAEAAKSSEDAAGIAKNGGGVMRSAVEKIEKISRSTNETATMVDALGRSSNRIGEIIAVINDIADQTNLLALNAAIEAARAGEQGRGFAVVADEVRKLSERTTKATKEIAEMIKTIQHDTSLAMEAMAEGGAEVDEGLGLVQDAEAALGVIVNRVGQVSEMVRRIAAASGEQGKASEDVTQNVENIAGVIRQNSSAVNESTAAAQELARLAGALQDLVSKFNVGGGPGSLSAEPQAPVLKGNVINGRALFRARGAA